MHIPLFWILLCPPLNERHGTFPNFIASSLPFWPLRPRFRLQGDFPQALADELGIFRKREIATGKQECSYLTLSGA
jgi:hypothetical protein